MWDRVLGWCVVAGLAALLGAAAGAWLTRDPPPEPTDADLLTAFAGDPTGELVPASPSAPSRARLHARATLLRDGRPALVALFTMSADAEGARGAWPIQELRALGALVCEPARPRWRCGAPQPAVAQIWQAGAALSEPELLPIDEGRTGMRLTLDYEDLSSAPSELTLIGWLSADGLALPIRIQTAWNRSYRTSDGPGWPVSWRTELALRAHPGEPDPVVVATLQIADAATGAEGTWRRDYALRPSVSPIYAPIQDPVLVAGSAPAGGWRYRWGLGDEEGEDVSTTLLCDDGRATRTEERRDDGADPVVTASRRGRWEQRGLRASVTWEPGGPQEELLLIDTGALGLGPPERWERVERLDGPCAEPLDALDPGGRQ